MTTSAEPAHGTGDRVAAWLLYVLQLGLELILVFVAATSVMMTDPCGSGIDDEPRVCSGGYFAWAFFGYWTVLIVAAIAVPVLILIAGRRDRRRWPWPLAGILILVVSTVIYVIALTR